MGRMGIDDFIRYAKEQFDCEITVKKSDKPDKFSEIFGASFLTDNSYVEMIDDFESNVSYENVSIDVQFTIDGEMDVDYSNNFGLAA